MMPACKVEERNEDIEVLIEELQKLQSNEKLKNYTQEMSDNKGPILWDEIDMSTNKVVGSNNCIKDLIKNI